MYLFDKLIIFVVVFGTNKHRRGEKSYTLHHWTYKATVASNVGKKITLQNGLERTKPDKTFKARDMGKHQHNNWYWWSNVLFQRTKKDKSRALRGVGIVLFSEATKAWKAAREPEWTEPHKIVKAIRHIALEPHFRDSMNKMVKSYVVSYYILYLS